MKPKMLFISAHPPSPDIPQAGQKQSYRTLVEYLKEYEVYLVAFINEIEKEMFKPEKLSLCKETVFISFSRFNKFAAAFTHPWLPVKAVARISRKATRAIKNHCQKHHFAAAHFDFSEVSGYVGIVKNVPLRTLYIHDVQYQMLSRRSDTGPNILRIFYRLESFMQKSWEARTYSKFDEIKVISGKDRELLVEIGVPSEKIKVVTPYVDPAFLEVRRDRIEKNAVLFFAAFNRPENNDAALWFINEVLPYVRRYVPDVKVYLVGAYPSSSLKAACSDSVIVTGFVEDPIPYFERAQVAIAPLRQGAGVKNKVLIYIIARIPVVTTTVGAEGIQNELLKVADSAEGFGKALCQQLSKQNA